MNQLINESINWSTNQSSNQWIIQLNDLSINGDLPINGVAVAYWLGRRIQDRNEDL